MEKNDHRKSNPPNSPTEVMDFLHDMFFNLSKEIVKKRERIIRLAQERHANPRNQSNYCRYVLKLEFRRWDRKKFAREFSRGKYLIFRQVETHLRGLRDDAGILRSEMRYSDCGCPLAMFWGVAKWGPHMMQRRRRMPLEELIESLPDIPVGQGGKGVFKYKEVLPGYLVLILERFEAPLTTAELKSIIQAKLPFLSHGALLVPISPEHESHLSFQKDESVSDRSEEKTHYLDETEGLDEAPHQSEPTKSKKKK